MLKSEIAELAAETISDREEGKTRKKRGERKIWKRNIQQVAFLMRIKEATWFVSTLRPD